MVDRREENRIGAISLTGATVENVVPPLSVSETLVNKQNLLITTYSQMYKLETRANINSMTRPTRIITGEY